MLSKRVSLFFVILLIFQTIASGFITPSLVIADGDDQSVFRHVSVKDETDQDVDKDELEGEVAVDVHIDWSTSGTAVESGHTDSVVLDDALQVSEEQNGTLIVGAEDETIEVGAYDVTTDGTVTAVFNDKIEDNADASGAIVVKANIEGEKEEVESEESNKDESDRKSTRLNSSHVAISYAVFCLKKKINRLVEQSFPPIIPLKISISKE